MSSIVLSFAVLVLFIAVGAVRVVTRGRQMVELRDHGVEVSGTVVKKIKFNSKKSGIRSRYIRYEYTDNLGRRHSAKSMVGREVWDTHEEGSTLPVVYSQKNAAVSAPKYLVDQVRHVVWGQISIFRGV